MENTKTAPLQRRTMMKLAGIGAAASVMAGSAFAQTCTTTPAPTASPAPTPAPTTSFVPADDLPHTRVWMAWPASTAIWGSTLLGKIQSDWALLCRTIAKYEPVYVVAGSATGATNAKAKVGTTVNPVTYIATITNDDMWMRDTGCVFRKTTSGGLDCLKLNFNGWGAKQAYTKDAQVANGMASYLGLPLVTSTVVGEGGGLIHDGDGTLMAYDSCWVNSNRNGSKTRAVIEAELLKQYGAQKMLWPAKGVVGQDITDDHIDASIAFIAPGKVFMSIPEASASDDFALCNRAAKTFLQTATDAKGRPFQITDLPDPLVSASATNILPSYINYLVVNGGVINMAFAGVTGVTTDYDAATKTKLQAAYPGRTVEMIKLGNIYGEGGGGIHCITQQQPA